jgi:hypothetical protein
MSNLQDSVAWAEGRRAEDPQRENHPQITEPVPNNTGVLNSVHDATVQTEPIERDEQRTDQPFHLTNPAPTFERVENKDRSLVVELASWRWERQTRGQTQCIRCQVPTTEPQHMSLSSGATPLMGPDLTHEGQVLDPVARGSSRITLRSIGIMVGLPRMHINVQQSIRYSTPKDDQSNIPRYFVVLGVFSKADNLPQDRIIFFTNPKKLFRYLFWAIVRLRGITGLFSLKDVKGFALYTVRTSHLRPSKVER